jgi:membrane protein implicated in regulation of membrane protease activity
LFLPASIAAVVVGLLGQLYPYVSFPIQILFFVVTSGGFIWITRSYLNNRMAKMQQQQKIFEQRSYVGQVLTLVSPIENGHATQDLDGMVWTLHGQDCPAGTPVKVVDMGEGWLKVEPL